MTAAQIKILVSVFLVLALWRIFEIPGVATAFWDLCTVGAIPGSDRVLGTETVLRVLCILFGVAVFLIFRKEFFASLPQRSPKAPTAAPISSQQSQSQKDGVVIVLTRHKDRPELRIVRPLLVTLVFAAAGIVQFLAWIETGSRRSTAWLGRTGQRTSNFLYACGQTVARQIYRFLRKTFRIIIDISNIIWKLSEPHIRTFDKWLDAQLHANKSTADILHFMDGTAKAAQGGYHKAKRLTRTLLEDK
jgi:hypothetical protein